MNFPKLPPALLAALFLVTLSATAQEDPAENADVDRILSELAATPTPATESPSTPPSMMGETSMTEEASEDLVSSETEPIGVPAISLEEATETEGLSIQSSGENFTQGLITVNLSEAPLEKVITIFARASGANIIIPQGLSEPVSANLYDVFWRDALDVILADKGYALVERSSGIYTINALSDIETEPLSSETIEFQFITAEAALPAVQSLLVSSNATVIDIKGSNHIIIREKIQHIEEIKRMVKIIDRPQQQVFIEAKFVELNDTSSSQIGINWQMLGGEDGGLDISGDLLYDYDRLDNNTSLNSEGFTQFNRTDSGRNVTTTSEGLTIVDGFNSQFNNFQPDDQSIESSTTVSSQGRRGNGTALVQGRNIENATFNESDDIIDLVNPIPTLTRTIARSATLSPLDFALTLSALQELDGTQIISNPKILVASGETANIKIGEEQPNIRGETIQTEFSIQTVFKLDTDQPYITDGITIEVSPTVSTDKNITVVIKPELQRILNTIVTPDGSRFPVIITRRIDTEFAVQSGNTVAIGGLTTTRENEVVTKVPFLGDLPLIGKYLFSHTETQDIQDEIIIFITVESINDTADMNDRDGIPNEGRLIYNWLDFQDEKAAEMEEKETPPVE